MKRVGTITSAVGFIFIGAWLILRNFAFALSGEIIKWWPILIILFGVEIILFNNIKREEEKVGFNFLVIPMIIIFLGINGFVAIENRLPKNFNVFHDGLSVVLDDVKINSNSRKIETEKVLDSFGKKFTFNTNNGDIVIKKSEDGKIRLNLNVYVDNNDKRNSYEIKEKKTNDGYEISINDNFVEGVDGEIYLPENLDVFMKINNVKFDSQEYAVSNSLTIDCNNASIYVGDTKNLFIKANNGLVQGKTANIANVSMNNGKIVFDGDVREGKIKLNNGEVKVDNKICKDLNIELNLGSVKVETEDNNMDVSMKINQGKVRVNEDSRVNSSLSKKIGNGEGKLNIDVKTGSIDVETNSW